MFVLVVGAIAGVYLGFAATAGDGARTSAAPAGTEIAVDPARQQALDAAQKKAALAAAEAAADAKKADEVARRAAEEASRSQPRTSYPVPTSCKEYDGNRAIGCALLLEAGFGLDQMPCLDRLWTRESGWNPKAQNTSSGAYGIPQALPGDKMAKYGDDWRTNPVPQIKWGLDYIKNRYGTPCSAWSSFQSKGWY